MAMITGNTYPVRDKLAAMGGRWVPALKGWNVPESRADEARALVASTPAVSKRGTTTARQPRTCKDCGCRINYGVYCGKCEYC